ncbi:MAG: pyridoxal 5'-phosphate synthase [Solirubrobacterales bacterium]
MTSSSDPTRKPIAMDVSRVSLRSLTSTVQVDLPEFQIPPADPFELAAQWIARAIDSGAREPGTFALATADSAGRPSSRFLLLKGFDDTGLLFVSQTTSRKGSDLASNPYASASFYWQELRLQLHMFGTVEIIPAEESDALFAPRPLPSKAVASVSRQGQDLLDENIFNTEVTKLIAQGNRLDRPDRWVGYRLKPERFEFWHGAADRMHQRLEYTFEEENWNWRRVQP